MLPIIIDIVDQVIEPKDTSSVDHSAVQPPDISQPPDASQPVDASQPPAP
jgi:hypothetical protein